MYGCHSKGYCQSLLPLEGWFSVEKKKRKFCLGFHVMALKLTPEAGNDIRVQFCVGNTFDSQVLISKLRIFA